MHRGNEGGSTEGEIHVSHMLKDTKKKKYNIAWEEETRISQEVKSLTTSCSFLSKT